MGGGKSKYTVYISSLAMMVLVGSFFFNQIFVSPLFPGILAVIPCVSTALLINANKEEHFVSKILSHRWVVWVGKLSYSLYLWHWVILAIMRYVYQDSELPIEWIVIAVFLMFILSIFTYYYVENPIRKTSFSLGKNMAYFYIVPSFVVFFVVYNMNLKESKLITSDLLYPENICHNTLEYDCIKGDTSKKPKILVIGNSYVGQWNGWIDAIGKKEAWSATVVSSDSCPFLFDNEFYRTNRFYKYCSKRDDFFYQNYKNYPIIVLHYSDLENKEFEGKFLETCKRLIEEGKKVYVIASMVESNINPLRGYYLQDRGLSFREAKRVNFEENILAFIPEEMGVRKIDIRNYIPDNFYIDGKPIYKDKTHWNIYGASKMAEKFMENERLIKIEDLEMN